MLVARRADDSSVKKAVRQVLRIVIAIGLLAIVAGSSLMVMPGLALLTVPDLKSTSEFCTVWKGMRETSVKTQQAEIAARLQKNSKVIRTEGEFRLWQTPEGDFWVPDGTENILTALLAQQDRYIYGTPSDGGVKSGDVVLDCGAHVGTYVKRALRDGASLVIAIEPAPPALECLRRNLAKEIADGRVKIVPKGVWDENTTLTFYENGNGSAGDSFVNQGEGAKVVANIPVARIDSLVAELNLPRVDIIKADVKGATERAIRGAQQTLTRWKPRLVFSTEEPPENPGSIMRLVKQIRPDYEFRPGPCIFDGSEIRSETVFFR
jgi:FkbM family methyltransferase